MHHVVIIRAATDLKVHVELAARELSLERFTKFENELYQVRLFPYFFSLSTFLRLSFCFIPSVDFKFSRWSIYS
jgi:hypothetical protein